SANDVVLIIVLKVLESMIVSGGIHEIAVVFKNGQQSFAQSPVFEIREVLRRAEVPSRDPLSDEQRAKSSESSTVLAVRKDRVVGDDDSVSIGVAPEDIVEL